MRDDRLVTQAQTRGHTVSDRQAQAICTSTVVMVNALFEMQYQVQRAMSLADDDSTLLDCVRYVMSWPILQVADTATRAATTVHATLAAATSKAADDD